MNFAWTSAFAGTGDIPLISSPLKVAAVDKSFTSLSDLAGVAASSALSRSPVDNENSAKLGQFFTIRRQELTPLFPQQYPCLPVDNPDSPEPDNDHNDAENDIDDEV
jgi:hypothetical protein